MNYAAALQSKKAKGGRNSSGKPRNGASGSKLNPFAREWDPVRDRAPEEDRGLFLTFALGLPLNDTEIHQFFNQRFGPCIERVYHPRRADENRPKYVKVIFHLSYIPVAVLGNQNEAKFMVNSKPMWCKRFKPIMN